MNTTQWKHALKGWFKKKKRKKVNFHKKKSTWDLESANNMRKRTQYTKIGDKFFTKCSCCICSREKDAIGHDETRVYGFWKKEEEEEDNEELWVAILFGVLIGGGPHAFVKFHLTFSKTSIKEFIYPFFILIFIFLKGSVGS